MSKENVAQVRFDRESSQFTGLTDAVMKQLQDMYKGVDVPFELRKMIMWFATPKGKRSAGSMAFIMKWLERIHPSFTEVKEQLYCIDPDSPLGILAKDYLKGLWKGRERLLDFNTL